MNTVTTADVHPAVVARPARRRARAVAVAAATAGALAVWTVAVPLAGVDLVARTGGTDQTVGSVPVAVTTVLVGLAGWALLALLERLTRLARPIWTGLALAVLLVSMLGPLTGGVGVAAKLTLAALHLAVAAVLIPMLLRSARAR